MTLFIELCPCSKHQRRCESEIKKCHPKVKVYYIDLYQLNSKPMTLSKKDRQHLQVIIFKVDACMYIFNFKASTLNDHT